MSATTEAARIATAQKAEISADPTWQGVYREGGLCLVLTGLIYLIGGSYVVLPALAALLIPS